METAGTKGRRGCECCLAGRFDVPGRGAVSVFLLFPGEDQSRFVQKRHRFFYPLSYLSIIRRVMDEIRGDLSSLERENGEFSPDSCASSLDEEDSI